MTKKMTNTKDKRQKAKTIYGNDNNKNDNDKDKRQ